MRWIVALLSACHIAMWWASPSRWIDLDALDEIMLVERPSVDIIAKHPLAEPLAWVVFRAFQSSGYAGDAIRPTQVISGVCVTATLLLLGVFYRRRGASRMTAVVLPTLIGCTYAFLRMARDPYLFYIPLGFAFATAAVCVLLGPARPLLLAVATTLMTLGVLFNPMVIALIPPAAVSLVTSDHASLRSSVASAFVARITWVAVPLASLGMAFWQTNITSHVMNGPWGTFYGGSLQHSLVGLAGMVLAPLSSTHLLSAFAYTATAIMFAVWWLSGLAIVGRHTLKAPGGIVWLLAVATTTLFVIWWEPRQTMFWTIPLWLSLLAFANSHADLDAHSPASWPPAFARIAMATGCAALFLNAWLYVWPTATRDDPERQAALAVAEMFKADDLLIYPVYQDLRVEYWGHRQTTAWIPLHMFAKPGERSLRHLARQLAARRLSGGRIWMLVGSDGVPFLDVSLFERGDMGVTLADLSGLDLGETRVAAGRVFREIVSIRF